MAKASPGTTLNRRLDRKERVESPIAIRVRREALSSHANRTPSRPRCIHERLPNSPGAFALPTDRPQEASPSVEMTDLPRRLIRDQEPVAGEDDIPDVGELIVVLAQADADGVDRLQQSQRGKMLGPHRVPD